MSYEQPKWLFSLNMISLDRVESWFRVCLRDSFVRRKWRYLFRYTTYDAPTCRYGRQTDRQSIGICTAGRVKPSWTNGRVLCVVHGVCRRSGDRLVCRSVVGQSHSYRAASCCSRARARVRKNKESPGNVASQKSILVHRLLQRGFETSV